MNIDCPNCGERVDEQAPACPNCGEKIDIEEPADMPRVRHNIQPPPPNAPDVRDAKHDDRSGPAE